MDNPYAAPASTPSTQADAGGTGLGWLTAGLLCAVVTAAMPTLVLPNFASVFDAFGADLPLLTRWLLRYHLLLWALPFALLALRFAGRDPLRRSKRVFLIGLSSLPVMLVALPVLIYWPIFQLARAV
jgi:type II secretory pathway component PulF